MCKRHSGFGKLYGPRIHGCDDTEIRRGAGRQQKRCLLVWVEGTVDVETVPGPVFQSVTTTAPQSCNPETPDGQIEIRASYSGALRYSIDGGATTQPGPLFTGLPAGTYEPAVLSADGSCRGDHAEVTLQLPAGGCDNCTTGAPCDDGDPCTINDVYDADCNCAGTFQDTDNDGVCDAADVCPGGDDTVDTDADGTPDACDPCDDTTIGMPCDDGDPATGGDVIQPDCSCRGVSTDLQSVCVAIAAGADDAEEDASGDMSLTSSDLELIMDGNDEQIVGLRFTGLNIPPGARILSASVQFAVDETNNEDPCELQIYGEASGDAPPFTNDDFNLSGRPRTTAFTSWRPPAWENVNEAAAAQRTPDLSAVLQEVVDREDYTESSAIALLIEGTGKRVARSYNGSATLAPSICVEYRLHVPEICDDGLDNDGDGLTDCDDPDCFGREECMEICGEEGCTEIGDYGDGALCYHWEPPPTACRAMPAGPA